MKKALIAVAIVLLCSADVSAQYFRSRGVVVSNRFVSPAFGSPFYTTNSLFLQPSFAVRPYAYGYGVSGTYGFNSSNYGFGGSSAIVVPVTDVFGNIIGTRRVFVP